MFEPFRGSGRHARAKGLGLGLYITQEIVRAHQGSIGVTSNPAEGTSFELTLPRALPSA
jgi:signal transduction histidine kinase